MIFFRRTPATAGAVAALASSALGASYLAGHAAARDGGFALRIAVCAVAAGLLFGVYIGVVRRVLAAHDRRVRERLARRRIAPGARVAAHADPLADEEAELEARFAELEAHETAR
jgi:hypothetical protein